MPPGLLCKGGVGPEKEETCLEGRLAANWAGILEKQSLAPPARLVGVLSVRQKGCGFHSGSGHNLAFGFNPRSGCIGGNQLMFLSH